MARVSDEDRKRFLATVEAQDSRTAVHEAGHAVAALYFGRAVKYVQAGVDAHLAYDTDAPGVPSEEVAIVCTLAGDVAVGVIQRRIDCPPPAVMKGFFDKIRDGRGGDCDACRIACLLTLCHADETDDELAVRWRVHMRKCVELFDYAAWRRQLRRLAAELQKRVLLTGADLAELVDVEALRRSADTRAD